ncbi:MAG: Ig-like domain-containing protein [Clostridiales bacterium]|nr:Ig-like domain-containing protein [Clostridiales bacterium]
MDTTSNTNKKKVTAIVVLIALIVSMVLGGTYAFFDFNQHKSNELGGFGIKYEARLVEDFVEIPDWRVEDGVIDKKIHVVNHGKEENGFGDVYVRIQLKEYMEIGKVAYIETPKRYKIDTEGHFVIYDTLDEVTAAVAIGGEFEGHNYAYLTDFVTGNFGYFIETQDGDRDGQMGKHVVTDIKVGDPEKVIKNGPDRATSTNHHGHPSEECDYAIHSWKDGSELETRDYVDWHLNTGAIIKLSEWLDPAGAYKGLPIAKWIIDDLTDEGWVYWGQMLRTDGDETALFMEGVSLIQQPDGSFYYVIHTEMEAVSFDELLTGSIDWGVAGENIVLNAPSAAWLGETPKIVQVGSTVAAPGLVIGPEGSEIAPIVWSSSNPAIAKVDQNGNITGVAVGGPVTIVAKAPNGAKAMFTIKVVPEEPAKPDTDLPIKETAGGFFTPIIEANAFNGDSYYGVVNFEFPEKNKIHQHGSIHLSDIIADGNYEGITVTPVDPKYDGMFYIAEDKHNELSLFYSYFPTNDEWVDWITEHQSWAITIAAEVELVRDDGMSAIITVHMTYDNCLVDIIYNG